MPSSRHRIVAVLPGPTAAAAQRPHVAQGGFFLPWLEPPPEPFASLVLEVRIPAGAVVELPARVVHLASGAGIALAFEDAAAARRTLSALFDSLAGGDAEGPLTARWYDPDEPTQASSDRADDEGIPPELEEDDPSEAATLFARIRAMGVPEKIQLAAHGDRAARLLLMKDPNKVIHNFIIQNPRITLEEVRYLAGYRQANPDTLKMISEHREWMQNPGVLSALVSNPKTPSLIAVKLVDRLPMSEVRRIAKSDGVVRAVQLAARKRVAGPG